MWQSVVTASTDKCSLPTAALVKVFKCVCVFVCVYMSQASTKSDCDRPSSPAAVLSHPYLSLELSPHQYYMHVMYNHTSPLTHTHISPQTLCWIPCSTLPENGEFRNNRHTVSSAILPLISVLAEKNWADPFGTWTETPNLPEYCVFINKFH